MAKKKIKWFSIFQEKGTSLLLQYLVGFWCKAQLGYFYRFICRLFLCFFLPWRSSNVKLSVISVSEEIKKHQKMVCRVGIKGLWAEITVGVSFTTVARRQWWNFILTCIVKRYSFTTVAVVKLIQPFRMAKIRVCYSLRYVYEEMRYFFVRVKNYY